MVTLKILFNKGELFLFNDVNEEHPVIFIIARMLQLLMFIVVKSEHPEASTDLNRALLLASRVTRLLYGFTSNVLSLE